MVSHRTIARIGSKPASTAGLVIIFAAFGFALIFQSVRWYTTPAYGNLLDILSADSWGAIYVGVAILLALGLFVPRPRLIPLVAHMAAFVLVASWEAAFVVRWLTDPHTTVVNVMSWLTYLALIVRSVTLIDAYPPAEPDGA